MSNLSLSQTLAPVAAAPNPGDLPVQPAQALDPAQRGKIEKAAVQFEGLFIHQMLKEMRRSADEIAGEDAIFKGQSGNGLLDIADTMMADAMAGQRAFGIADTIVRQMLPAATPPAGVALQMPTQAPLKFPDAAVALPLDRREVAPASSISEPRGPLP